MSGPTAQPIGECSKRGGRLLGGYDLLVLSGIRFPQGLKPRLLDGRMYGLKPVPFIDSGRITAYAEVWQRQPQILRSTRDDKRPSRSRPDHRLCLKAACALRWLGSDIPPVSPANGKFLGNTRRTYFGQAHRGGLNSPTASLGARLLRLPVRPGALCLPERHG